MKMKYKIGCLLALGLAYGQAWSQDAVSAITRTSDSSSGNFAVFDVRPSTLSQEKIRDEIAAAIRTHYDHLKIQNLMAPYPIPDGAPRMTFRTEGSIQVPECRGATASIVARDSSFSSYGEGTVIQSCIFPYQAGYRVNFYGFFMQRSGGANTNVLGAMLGRVFTNAVGLGDSSRFIHKTIDEIESRLRELSPSVSLVELQPAREGKQVVPDLATLASAGSAPTTSTSVASGQPNTSISGLQEVRARIAEQNRQNFGGALSASSAIASEPPPGAVIQARKDLAGMGLTYHSADDFVAAIKRKDTVATELFIVGQGVPLNSPDRTGVTPLAAAASIPEIKQLFLRIARGGQ